jgi:glycosyltransferase involved in cell wall biosynthesis
MADKKKKILFLFPELAGYILACMKQLAADTGIEVHVIKWPVNKIAPFNFSLEGENITFYERNDFTDDALVTWSENLNPDIIFCSGWMDKGYVNVCKAFHHKIKTVLTFDNPWRNTIKQNIATLVSPFYLKNIFSDCWVCGPPQMTYAIKLGFDKNTIEDGFYSCDFGTFNRYYKNQRALKEVNFPKRFIFVGRYTKLKGTLELWNAFIDFCKSDVSIGWELWCLGKGDFDNRFPEHPQIKNLGFVQPNDIEKYISKTGVFVLPSHYEHWGVVVHEFAAAGFPLVCTTTTGAASTFLKDGVNGYYIKQMDQKSLVEVFTKIASLKPQQLLVMGDKSADIASVITPEKWIQSVIKYLES